MAERAHRRVNIYTTCRGCGGLLHVTDGLNYHNGEPPCTPKPTKIERLSAQWLAAIEAGDTTLADRLETEINTLDSRPPRLGAAAEQYARWGWPVFPLRPGEKRPATKHGFKDATTDLERIRAWWKRHPDSNIGLPTGHKFDVIDIDVPDGPRSYLEMIDDNIIPDIHAQVATSSGGIHLYILPTGDGNGTRIKPGIDYRGIGGYVVAPPSTLGPRGRAWNFVHRPSPTITGATT